MSDTLVGESVADVIGTATAHGFTVTEPQLVRWHRKGLLPPIGQPIPRRFLGRGRGSETIYPPGTGAQVIAICRALAEKRDLSRAGWSLWWRGYQVTPSFARDPVEAALKGLEEFVAFIREKGGLSDKMLDAANAQHAPPLIGKMRRRVGREAFRRIMRVCLAILDGTFTDFKGEDEDLIERALRLDEARGTRVAGMKLPLPEDITVYLRELARRFNVARLREILEGATDADLAAARDEIRATLVAADTFLYLLERVWGRGGFLRVVLPNSETVDDDGQPLFLLLWLSLRRLPEFTTGYPKVMEAMNQLASLRPIIAALPSDIDLRQLAKGAKQQRSADQ